MATIVFLSCHLSGTGHLVRILTLARAARARGHDVVVLNGGRALAHVEPGVEVDQLPPVTIRGLEFAVLRQPSGEPAGPAYMARRRAAITTALEGLAPDVLVTELYPFGRRALGDEFRHAIAEARRIRPAVAILCSVRDIPEPKPKRLGEVATLLADLDGVLVHGDAAFLPLSATWPLPEGLAPLLHHTGYVGRPMPGATRGDTVLVSCGGGVLGRRLTGIAIAAARHSARPWHVLVGGADGAAAAAELRGSGLPPNLVLEPIRTDFPALLAGAACSVSLCGYNTAVELAQCRTPAILVPSREGGEQEQGLRAAAFARLPGFRVIEMDTLTPEALAKAADDMAAGPDRAPAPLVIDDGTAAVQVIETILAERTRP